MEVLISKLHRELELFSAVKPLLILEGNITDKFRYPSAGSLPEDSLVPLPRYLMAFFADRGWDSVVFYSNLMGLMNPYDPGMLSAYAKAAKAEGEGLIQSVFEQLRSFHAETAEVRAWE